MRSACQLRLGSCGRRNNGGSRQIRRASNWLSYIDRDQKTPCPERLIFNPSITTLGPFQAKNLKSRTPYRKANALGGGIGLWPLSCSLILARIAAARGLFRPHPFAQLPKSFVDLRFTLFVAADARQRSLFELLAGWITIHYLKLTWQIR